MIAKVAASRCSEARAGLRFGFGFGFGSGMLDGVDARSLLVTLCLNLSRSIAAPARSQVRDAHRSQRAPSRWFGEALPLLPIESAPRVHCPRSRCLDGTRRVFAFGATLTANRGYVIGILDPDPEYVLSAPGTRFVPAAPRLPINLAHEIIVPTSPTPPSHPSQSQTRPRASRLHSPHTPLNMLSTFYSWSIEHIKSVFEAKCESDCLQALDETFSQHLEFTFNGSPLTRGGLQKIVLAMLQSSGFCLNVDWQNAVEVPRDGSNRVSS